MASIKEAIGRLPKGRDPMNPYAFAPNWRPATGAMGEMPPWAAGFADPEEARAIAHLGLQNQRPSENVEVRLLPDLTTPYNYGEGDATREYWQAKLNGAAAMPPGPRNSAPTYVGRPYPEMVAGLLDYPSISQADFNDRFGDEPYLRVESRKKKKSASAR